MVNRNMLGSQTFDRDDLRSNMGQPSIGASLMDAEAVSLNPNLLGKKKKKKAKKANLMGRMEPNALFDSQSRQAASRGGDAAYDSN